MKKASSLNTYKRLLSYLVPYKGRLILAVFCTVGYAFAHSLVSLTVFLVLNGIKNNKSVAVGEMPQAHLLEHANLPFDVTNLELSVNWIPVVVVLVFLVRGLFEYLSRYQMSVVGLRVVRLIRDRLYRHLTGLSMNFYSKGRVGDLMSRVVQDVSVVQSGVTDVLVDLAKQPLVLFFQIIFVFYWGGSLALVAILVFPLVLIPLILLGNKLRVLQKKTQEQISEINSQMQETFSGMSVVKAFNMEEYENKKFETFNKNVFRFLKRAIIITTGQRPLIEILGACAIAFSIWYGMKVLPLDRFASFLTCLFLLYEPLKKLSKVNATIQQSVGAGERIFDLLNIEAQIQNKPDAKVLEGPISSVEFKDVSFSYNESDVVLKNLNIKVNAQEVVAIVGTSGAGKTTLVNLLPRFYDVTKGSLLINGIDVRDLDMKSLRKNIGIVNQETFLFNATVFENIAYGRMSATMDEVKEAAKKAFADDFIKKMPKGYATVIGERGVTLSGGQRQRLSIARALLKDPPILILDEATSQLDTESEREVQKALELLMKERTVFVIAHRLSTIQNASRILVFDKGELVQSGTSDSLLEQGGVYKRLYDLQFTV